jgi:nucleoside-diphosphate-sugar epimerase
MGSVDAKPLVLLTGPNGFVGAHVLDRLLSEGYRVRGTLRSQAKAKFFEKKYANRSSDISFAIVPDIQAPNALDAAMTDVDYVCHVASPYVSPHPNVTTVSTLTSLVHLNQRPTQGAHRAGSQWN